MNQLWDVFVVVWEEPHCQIREVWWPCEQALQVWSVWDGPRNCYFHRIISSSAFCTSVLGCGLLPLGKPFLAFGRRGPWRQIPAWSSLTPISPCHFRGLPGITLSTSRIGPVLSGLFHAYRGSLPFLGRDPLVYC